MSSIATFIVENITRILVFGWDISLTIVNVLTPSRRIGYVISERSPGAGGKWPQFIAPGEGDSRSACPALNALSNHGRGQVNQLSGEFMCYQAFFLEVDEISLSRN